MLAEDEPSIPKAKVAHVTLPAPIPAVGGPHPTLPIWMSSPLPRLVVLPAMLATLAAIAFAVRLPTMLWLPVKVFAPKVAAVPVTLAGLTAPSGPLALVMPFEATVTVGLAVAPPTTAIELSPAATL